MKIGTLVLTLLLVGGFVTGFAGFFGSMAAKYNVADSPGFHDFGSLNASSQYYNDVQGTLNTQYDTMGNAQNNSIDITATDAGAAGNLFNGAYNAAWLVIKTPTYFIALIYDIGKAAMIPDWAMTMLIAAILCVVIFALIQFLTGRDA